MSFSQRTKEELSYQNGTARHCLIAELAAILSVCGEVLNDQNGNILLRVQSENIFITRKCFTILLKTFNIYCDIHIRNHMHTGRNRIYILEIKDTYIIRKILSSVKFVVEDGKFSDRDFKIDPVILRKSCCKRAFLRGAFLCTGSISDPEKTYHFEIVCSGRERAQQICDLMRSYDIEGKWIIRKKHFVVYIKEADQIVDMLNVMEAHISLMELENIRIFKEMRNSVNRRVNCEMANISKTVSAAVKQVEDITYIKETIGFGELNEGLQEIAKLRLEYQEATLLELGKMLSPPVGKSGVNHRLRKLSSLANDLRSRAEE